MDLYWEQVVQNILGGATTTTISRRTAAAMPMMKKSEVAIMEAKPTGARKKSRLSKKKKVDEVQEKPKRRRQKNYHLDDEAIEAMKNLSVTSDEGIDISYSPLSASMSSIAKAIMRPQHHLATIWTFWYSVGNKNLSWEQNQIKISTVSTIEQFWFVTSQLRPPSNIPTGHTYSVFRGGVLPDWEDVANVEGGRWMISCPKVERENMLDTSWLEVLFMMVGEHMGESSRQVNGAEACVRTKGDRLEVWVRDINMMKDVLDVGRKVTRKIKFALHKEDKEGVKGPRLAL